MNGSLPKTSQEIRDLMRTDLSLVTDQDLIALVLARGSEYPSGAQGLKKTWTAAELAAELYAAAGENLAQFVENLAISYTSLKRFGIRESPIGARLIAAVELTFRWNLGFTDGVDSTMRPDPAGMLQKTVLRGRETSEAELIAVVLGDKNPDRESARRLLEEFGSPQDLMTSLALDVLESSRKEGTVFMRLEKTGAEIEEGSLSRLFAAVQLAHHYSLQSTLTPVRLEPGALGFESDELVQLLNPRSSLDLEVRRRTVESLRSDPRLARDFAKLDQLAREAQVSNDQYAVWLSLMFEKLCERRTWVDPSQVIGRFIPYDSLLAIANARIERSSAPPSRFLEVRDLLSQAAQDALAGPVDSFVKALMKLRLPSVFVERAIEEVRRRCTEK